jgi:hypothetical protein
MLESPARVWFTPGRAETSGEIEVEDVQRGIWPEVGSRMLTRVVTGQDLCDRWVIAQGGVSAIHDYLATEVLWA